MERAVRSLKLLWRSERLLAERQLQLGVAKTLFIALAGLIAVFGLGMFSVALFFALAPLWGEAPAALSVGVANLVLAGGLGTYARSLQPGTEIEMVQQVRDMAMTDLEEEAAFAEAEVVALKDDVRSILKNPMEALLPSVVSPLLRAVTGGLRSAKTKKRK